MATNIERGTRADFFVHPGFHRQAGHLITEGVRLHETALVEKVARSLLPVLIYDPGTPEQAGDFWNRFPPDQRFPSIPDRSLLDDSNGTRASFNRLLSEREVLRGVVHGSYLEACVREFRRSLRASVETDILYACPPGEVDYDDSIDGPEAVTYGLVLSWDGNRKGAPVLASQDIPPELALKLCADAQIFCAS